MSRGTSVTVALALARRQMTILLKNPSLFLPPLLFPLMNFMAFAGGLSRLRHIPGFNFPSGYTSFVFVFVLLQSAAFGGVFTGFGIARDFERGFARRLLIASKHRSGIVWGYAVASLFRWSTVAVMLTIVALIAHMQVGGDGVDLFGLYALAVIVNVCGLLWACGVAMRFRSVQAGPLMQTPIFILLFLSPVYVPLRATSGMDPRRREAESDHLHPHSRTRLHLGRADRRGARLRDRVRPLRRPRLVGAPRPQARRANRLAQRTLRVLAFARNATHFAREDRHARLRRACPLVTI